MTEKLGQIQAVVEGQPYPLLFVTISGAHLYGFPSADSDYDLRGVHVLPAGDMLGLRQPRETIDVSRKPQRPGSYMECGGSDAALAWTLDGSSTRR